MSHTPTQESFLENWLKRRQGPVALRRRKPVGAERKGQNPKWSDDAWFEKKYGDPDYYNRIKGLN
jgi:hypothetical protein